MERVTSRDGTAIAFERSGSGPPLVLVHGTTADHTRWHSLVDRLGERFTCCLMDRRGRGQSGDSPSYSLEREYEDVASVVDAVGRPAHLLGHSFGALCALEAALLTPNISALVLYEPAFPTDDEPLYPQGTVERLQTLLDREGPDAMLSAFFRDVVQMSEEEIGLLKADRSWPGRVASALTVVRECADGDYVFDPTRFQEMTVPTLLLVGGASPPVLRRPSERVAAALPESRVVEMPGQGHVAMVTAPELFLREVTAFLAPEEPAS